MALTPEEKKAKKIASKERQLARTVSLVERFTAKLDAKQTVRVNLLTELSITNDPARRNKLQAKIDKASDMVLRYSEAITRYNFKVNVLTEELRILKL